MNPIHVLFLCRQNSACSQMAEAFLEKYGGDQFTAESAGIEAGTLNPLVIQAMQEVGVNISRKETKTVKRLFREWRHFHWVILTCDVQTARQCPVWPYNHQAVHWDLPDPITFPGTTLEMLQQIRLLRDHIDQMVRRFIETVTKSTPASIIFNNNKKTFSLSI